MSFLTIYRKFGYANESIWSPLVELIQKLLDFRKEVKMFSPFSKMTPKTGSVDSLTNGPSQGRDPWLPT
jgi:hypothetical protein